MANYRYSTPSGPLDVLLERLSNPKPAGPNGWQSSCPAHGTGHNSALSIRLEGDRILVHCFAGCEPETILEALGFAGWADLYQGTAGPYSPPLRVASNPTPDQNQQAKLERLWQSARPIRQGDTMSRYLAGRGLVMDTHPAVLRYHPALEYWDIPEGQATPQRLGIHPAMLARVEHPEHSLVALHRTYQTTEGRKAAVPSPKKLSRSVFEGAVMGAAICLYPPTERLALAEGIETALAVHLATQWPVWATVSARGMARVQIPASVREVLIAADHDQAGLEAAHALAHRLVGDGVRVRIATPPIPGTDWLDVWQAEQQVVGNER